MGGAGGVGGAGGTGGITSAESVSLYALPDDLSTLAGESFFEHPWPSDFRFEANGKVRFAGFPNPRAIPLLDTYLEALVGLLR